MATSKITPNIAERIRKAEAILSDIDGTLIGSRQAQSATSLLRYEYHNKSYHKVVFGVLSGFFVYAGTEIQKQFRGSLPAENWGLSTYHKALSIVGIDKGVLQPLVKGYISRHELSGAKVALSTLKTVGKSKVLILATASSSVNAEVAAEYFEADSYVSNPTKYDSQNRVRGVTILIQTPNDKVELASQKLASYGRNLNASIFFGDSDADLAFREEVSVLVASPKAGEKFRRAADVQVSDYREFEEQLRHL